METVMTVTDLVRDTCKAATKLVQRGNAITITSGKRVLFRIVPNISEQSQLSPREYQSLVKDLDEIAANLDLDQNPIVKMRQERS